MCTGNLSTSDIFLGSNKPNGHGVPDFDISVCTKVKLLETKEGQHKCIEKWGPLLHTYYLVSLKGLTDLM